MIFYRELMDTARILALFRSDISFSLIPELCSDLATVFCLDKGDAAINRIRKGIASRLEHANLNYEDRLKWGFAFEEANNGCRIDSTVNVPLVFQYVFTNILEMITRQEFDKAYEFVDAVHCLPEVLINGKHISEYVHTYIDCYATKWNDAKIGEYFSISKKGTHRRFPWIPLPRNVR